MLDLYPNPPLIEAVFELRFAGEAQVETARPQIQDAVRSELPLLFVPKAVPDVAPALQAYEFRSENGSEIIGLAVNRFSYHSRKYEGFARFRERFLHFYAIFSEHVHIHRLTRVGLRYINHIPILRQTEEAAIPLPDYVNVELKLPPSIPVQLTDLNCAFTVSIDRDKLRILLQHKKLEGPAEREILILDFDFVQTERLDVTQVDAYLKKAHEYTKQVFFDLISERYLPVMRGEVQ